MKNKNMDSSEVNPELAKLEDLKIPFMSMNPINIYDVNIEDSLDPRTRNFIKTIFSAYKDSIEVANVMTSYDSHSIFEDFFFIFDFSEYSYLWLWRYVPAFWKLFPGPMRVQPGA
jgi:hypothetical protein